MKDISVTGIVSKIFDQYIITTDDGTEYKLSAIMPWEAVSPDFGSNAFALHEGARVTISGTTDGETIWRASITKTGKVHVAIQGIDIIYLHARDAEKLGHWYNEVLGLDLKFESPDNSWLEFDFDRSPPTRFAIEAAPSIDTSPVEQQSIMISLRVKDVKQAVESLEKRGIEFYGSPKIKEEGISRFATFQDPEGNWLQISQRIK